MPLPTSVLGRSRSLRFDPRMSRSNWGVLALLVLAGCAKPDLPTSPVRAGTTEELAEFRTEMIQEFGAGSLANFDIAIQELQLDAMERGIPTASAREGEMRSRVNRKTVRATEILGWKARAARLQREMALMRGLLDRDQKKEAEAKTQAGKLDAATHVRNEQDILARLEAQLAETQQHLKEWGAF